MELKRIPNEAQKVVDRPGFRWQIVDQKFRICTSDENKNCEQKPKPRIGVFNPILAPTRAGVLAQSRRDCYRNAGPSDINDLRGHESVLCLAAVLSPVEKNPYSIFCNSIN